MLAQSNYLTIDVGCTPGKGNNRGGLSSNGINLLERTHAASTAPHITQLSPITRYTSVSNVNVVRVAGT
jgi:hypothetical protein